MRYTLGKNKKLKSKKAIEALFESGDSIRKGALRLKFQKVDHLEENKVTFSVPKRFFKLAVDRNRVKRLLRESYRLQQHEILAPKTQAYHFMWIFQSNRLPDQEQIKNLMQSIIKSLNKSV